MIKHLVTMRTFKRAIRNKKPVLIEFYSPNCTSCRKMEGPLTALTEKYTPSLKVFKVDKDKDKLYDLIEDHDINLIPAFFLFANGREIDRIEGETTLLKLTTMVKKALNKAD